MWLVLMASSNKHFHTSFVFVMVSAMMLAAPGSSVTGMKGREEAPEADGVTADDGVTASSDDGTCTHKKHMVFRSVCCIINPHCKHQ